MNIWRTTLGDFNNPIVKPSNKECTDNANSNITELNFDCEFTGGLGSGNGGLGGVVNST